MTGPRGNPRESADEFAERVAREAEREQAERDRLNRWLDDHKQEMDGLTSQEEEEW